MGQKSQRLASDKDKTNIKGNVADAGPEVLHACIVSLAKPGGEEEGQ